MLPAQAIGQMDMNGSSSSGPIRVLVVDDVPEVVEELAVALEMMGFETVLALSYHQARDMLELAKRDDAAFLDAVVVDIRLGGVSGLLLMDDIEALWPTRKGPVVVYLSGLHADDVKQAALAHGAVGYLTKPSSIKDITRCILDGLDGRHRHNKSY
jgi:CheY-like chemotaxis protein